MNKRIKKKLRKRFGIFHYRNISKMTLGIISSGNSNDNFRILDKQYSGILCVGNGVSISQQLCEHWLEIKDVALLPRFGGDRIISFDLCKIQ